MCTPLCMFHFKWLHVPIYYLYEEIIRHNMYKHIGIGKYLL